MKESKIQKDILEYLKSEGIFCWKNFTTGIPDKNIDGGYRTNPNSGMSDIMGILPDGRFLAIEVKKPGHYTNTKRLAKQFMFLNRVIINGGEAYMVESLDETKKYVTTLIAKVPAERIKYCKDWAKTILQRMGGLK